MTNKQARRGTSLTWRTESTSGPVQGHHSTWLIIDDKQYCDHSAEYSGRANLWDKRTEEMCHSRTCKKRQNLALNLVSSNSISYIGDNLIMTIAVTAYGGAYRLALPIGLCLQKRLYTRIGGQRAPVESSSMVTCCNMDIV